MRRLIALLLSLLILPATSLAGEYDRYVERSARAETWFFEDLPCHLKNDLVESFLTPAQVWAWGTGTALTAWIASNLDHQIRDGLEPGDALGRSNKVWNIVGNGLVLGGATVIGFGISEWAGSRKSSLTFGTMTEALFVSQTLTFLTKVAVHRKRPDGSDNFSFPSSHASAAFTLAAVTESLHGPVWGVPSFALASVIAASRVDANEHFVSDVLFGALLGTLVGLGTARFHKKEFPDFFITPTAGEDSTGVAFVFPF